MQVAAVPFRWPAFLRSGRNATQPFYASHLRLTVEVRQQQASTVSSANRRVATGERQQLPDGALPMLPTKPLLHHTASGSFYEKHAVRNTLIDDVYLKLVAQLGIPRRVPTGVMQQAECHSLCATRALRAILLADMQMPPSWKRCCARPGALRATRRWARMRRCCRRASTLWVRMPVCTVCFVPLHSR